ncbi:hypothetical protein PpBr36_03147 [Pyricularia pennisetigena]|uniref:hypothetical protein n=1 Tax=Pyricularia pennisetigena TaxID=1578925 RepID=UPI00114EA840|nr:hypothetical protein PpBr36_03147 [Pyricularia pennisetigena]TLS30757.1 hypothetical protein PpBr36_03147 [Pyricularia pennisetigena]
MRYVFLVLYHVITILPEAWRPPTFRTSGRRIVEPQFITAAGPAQRPSAQWHARDYALPPQPAAAATAIVRTEEELQINAQTIRPKSHRRLGEKQQDSHATQHSPCLNKLRKRGPAPPPLPRIARIRYESKVSPKLNRLCPTLSTLQERPCFSNLSSHDAISPARSQPRHNTAPP